MIEMKAMPIIENSPELMPFDSKLGYLEVVIGALTWPGEKPGFIVVLGQEPGSASKPTPKIHQLAEYESFDLSDLLLKVLEYQTDYKCQTFYAPLSDSSVWNYLRHFNEILSSKRMGTVEVSGPPHWNDGKISYQVNVLKQTLRLESKRVWLLKNSSLPGHLNALPVVVSEQTEGKHPAVAALAYGVDALLTYYAHDPWPGTTNNRVQTDYNLFD